MKSYDFPLTVSYNFGVVDFGAGDTAYTIAVPPNVSSGRVEFVSVDDISETFTDTTTEAAVQIGTASDPDKFFTKTLGTAAADTSTALDGRTEAGKFIDLGRDGDSGAALTQLEMDCIAPTGGTPAGIGVVTAVISWF